MVLTPTQSEGSVVFLQTVLSLVFLTNTVEDSALSFKPQSSFSGIPVLSLIWQSSQFMLENPRNTYQVSNAWYRWHLHLDESCFHKGLAFCIDAVQDQHEIHCMRIPYGYRKCCRWCHHQCWTLSRQSQLTFLKCRRFSSLWNKWPCY